MESALNEELVAFAEEVQCAAMEIAGAALAGRIDLVQTRALSLCTRAANVKQGQLMSAEVSAPDRFDLATLTVNLQADAPEREEE
jgi:hypothetical protein